MKITKISNHDEVVIALLLIAILAGSCGPPPKLDQASQPLTYRVVETKDTSYAKVKRAYIRIVVDAEQLPVEQQLRAVAEEVSKARGRGLDELTVHVYLPGMDTNFVAYANAEFKRGSLSEIRINTASLMGTKWETKDAPQPAAAEAVRYKFDLNARKTGDREIQIALGTTLPEGATVLISVDRTYFERGSAEEYSGEIHSQDYPLKSGNLGPITIRIDDRTWHDIRQRQTREIPDIFKPIGRISSKVIVRAMFSPKRQKSQHVLEVIGRNGEKMKGNHSTGPIQILEQQQEFEIPFKR